MLEPATTPSRTQVSTALHSGISVMNHLVLQIMACAFPMIAGFFIYGWRAMGVVVGVVASTLVCAEILRRVGWRGRQIRLCHMLLSAIVLSLMLPAHLFTAKTLFSQVLWPIIPAAGISLALLNWLLGGFGAQRVPPAALCYLILFALFHGILTPHFVLRYDRALVGDVLNAPTDKSPLNTSDPWTRAKPASIYDSLRLDPPGDTLLQYTSAQQQPDRLSLSVQALIRDEMPPLEDLIIGGTPTSIGNASAVAVIIGGLFLLYQGIADYRVPLLGFSTAYAMLLVLPIPVYITPKFASWSWLAFRHHYLGAAMAITFVNYEVLATPLLFTLFFLASAPGLRPINRRGRAAFGALLGALSAALQLYCSQSVGPYIALILASMATPVLDRLLPPRTLVGASRARLE